MTTFNHKHKMCEHCDCSDLSLIVEVDGRYYICFACAIASGDQRLIDLFGATHAKRHSITDTD